MFTKNAEQRNVMCMMDKEMRMYMCMSNCAFNVSETSCGISGSE